MVQKFRKFRIITGCFVIFCCMLTATFVFADESDVKTRKSHLIERTVENNYVERELELSTTLEKTVIDEHNMKNIELEIVDGDVIATNVDDGTQRRVYSNGDAKYLSEVNLYYYDTSFILIICDDGSLYANVYKSVDENISFHKIALEDKINKLKVIEREVFHYEYPSVELYGLNAFGDWKLIKL